jgi:hypothetical protein
MDLRASFLAPADYLRRASGAAASDRQVLNRPEQPTTMEPLMSPILAIRSAAWNSLPRRFL